MIDPAFVNDTKLYVAGWPEFVVIIPVDDSVVSPRSLTDVELSEVRVPFIVVVDVVASMVPLLFHVAVAPMLIVPVEGTVSVEVLSVCKTALSDIEILSNVEAVPIMVVNDPAFEFVPSYLLEIVKLPFPDVDFVKMVPGPAPDIPAAAMYPVWLSVVYPVMAMRPPPPP